MLHRRTGASSPPEVTLGIQAEEFNLSFIRPENLVSHGLRVFRCLLANSKQGVMCIFTEEWLPSGHSNIKAWLWSAAEMFVHLEGATISTESSVSDHQVIGPSPLITQFGQASSSRKRLGGSNIIPFKNDGGHCVLGDLQCCRNVLVPFLRSVPRHNPVSELYGLVFALTCTVNSGTLYRPVCAFSNNVQSI